MALIKSISGIRGTIGGQPGTSLSPIDVVKFAAAYGTWLTRQNKGKTVVIGRDARISGEMVMYLVIGALKSVGLNVVNIGLATTPTVAMAVPAEKAAGGIILTASHNPQEWNALKLLNEKGEFISAADGESLLTIVQENEFNFVEVHDLGSYEEKKAVYLSYHIKEILALPLVDAVAIQAANFKVIVDGINSVGAIAVPALLEALGVEQVTVLNGEPNGIFAHKPEPVPENLSAICSKIKRKGADLGIVVDPDVDRLALVCEDGTLFGEEYTLVAISDYVLQHQVGATVSNLSSTQALKDVTEKAGGTHYASAVGEVNVVEKMKAVNAVIGGEGNGGVIYPELHYGRDALVGIALFLSYLAKFGKSCSKLRQKYPNYCLTKHKVNLTPNINVAEVLDKIAHQYRRQPISREDGVRIVFDKDWVHLRKSNTEPIIRIYAESLSEVTAKAMVKKIMADIHRFSSEE